MSDRESALEREKTMFGIIADDRENAIRAEQMKAKHDERGRAEIDLMRQDQVLQGSHLIEQHKRDDNTLTGWVLHDPEREKIGAQHRAELLGLHWELSGDKGKAAQFYNEAVKLDVARNELRSVMVQGDDRGTPIVKLHEEIGTGAREVPAEMISELAGRLTNMRAEEELGSVYLESKFAGLPEMMRADEQNLWAIQAEERSNPATRLKGEDLGRHQAAQQQTLTDMHQAVDVGAMASSLADHLAETDLHVAAWCRHVANRASETIHLKAEELDNNTLEPMSKAEIAINAAESAAEKVLDGVADIASAGIEGVASFFENLLGGGPTQKPPPRSRDRGMGI